MKILYLHQYFATPSMPGGTRSYEMARRLVDWGHEVHMVTSDQSPDAPGGKARETVEEGIRVHWCPVPYSHMMGFYARVRAFLEFAWAARKKAVEVGGDLVFATSTPLTIAIPAMSAARRLRVPMVFEVRDLWPAWPVAVGAIRNPLLIAAARRLERLAYRRSSHVVALSPAMRDGVVAAGVPREKVTVIPNGCDHDLFAVGPEAGLRFRERHPEIGRRPLVAYVGTLGRANGVQYIVRLAAKMREIDPEVRFLINGRGREEPEVRALARELGVLDRTLFMTPEVPKAEVPGILAAADLALSIFADVEALWGTSPNKFFDALAAGVPVATNCGGWVAELIASSGAGLVLDRRDPAVAAPAVARFLADPERVTRAREASARLGRERFARDDLAAELEAVLVRAHREACWPAPRAADERPGMPACETAA
jgi:glycosyltransferase involved in cell wall biosynthesis